MTHYLWKCCVNIHLTSTQNIHTDVANTALNQNPFILSNNPSVQVLLTTAWLYLGSLGAELYLSSLYLSVYIYSSPLQGDRCFCLSLQADSHFPPPAAISLDLIPPRPAERDPLPSSKKKFRPPPLEKYDAGFILMSHIDGLSKQSYAGKGRP